MRTILFAVVLVGLGGGCRYPRPIRSSSSSMTRGGVTLVRARCVGTTSCLLGQVIAAETATPLARATIFLERESTGPEHTPVEITALTDDQGVFTVEDPPKGRYRLQVFKRERRIEVRGLVLGDPGTAMVPVRLAPR